MKFSRFKGILTYPYIYYSELLLFSDLSDLVEVSDDLSSLFFAGDVAPVDFFA
jgi:hypothetical protein